MAIINTFSKKKSQGEGFIKINKTSLTIYGQNCRDTITVTKKLGTGNIIATSSDTNICTTSVSGDIITIIPQGTDGTATISIQSGACATHGPSNVCTCAATIYNFSDATAQPEDIMEGYQLYTRDGLITGTMPVKQAYTYGTSSATIPAGTYLAGDQTIPGVTTSITSGNVLSGVTMQTKDTAGNVLESISGSYTNISSNAVVASQIAKGYSAYANGNKISGNTLIKDANVVVSDRTFSMNEGSSTTIKPVATMSGNQTYTNGMDAHCYGTLAFKDANGTELVKLQTPIVTFTESHTTSSATVNAVCDGYTIASITIPNSVSYP